jgi:esterase
MKLFYRELGTGDPIIILHGLFGSSDNWLSIAKELANTHSIYLLDQRNHGQSPHSDTFDYSTMANDLEEFIDEHEIENPVILGHSMGGKTAMEFAVKNPDKWSKLIVVDIAPKTYSVHHDQILEGLNSLDLKTIMSRNEADEKLSKLVPEIGVRQFLLKNLSRDNIGFSWKINLPVISKNIEIIGEGLSKRLSKAKPTLFIRGSNSNYIMDSDFELIEQYFPSAKIETVENAGHWIHAEQPEEFLNIVNQFLKS